MARKTAAKAAKKKAERKTWVPNKSDLDAFLAGELTPEAKRMNAITDRAFRIEAAFIKSEQRRNAAMEKLHGSLKVGEKGLTVRSIDGKRQVIFAIHRQKTGNANALAAKQLIDEYIQQMLENKGATDDERAMLAFLGDVVTESRGQMLMTKNLTAFRRMKFSDERLRRAQKLLGDAFDVRESKLGSYCQELGDDGQWRKFGGE